MTKQKGDKDFLVRFWFSAFEIGTYNNDTSIISSHVSFKIPILTSFHF